MSLALSLLLVFVLLGVTSDATWWGGGRCGPTCAIACPCGRVMNKNGCPTCTCKPCSGSLLWKNNWEYFKILVLVCPPLCKIGCPCGNVVVNGCKICKCKPCNKG
ncbi:BPTI/Kunitz domain-containing protein 4-like [Gigantopelta aegis]|uniref:BPTI/Kunitz domain-containing protein 4-like n=1 Tax=Gigantopelta aegis TaxID=1735272 RepID=UPI001B88BE2C|nr:BPTI/Kunitz domain-containing protein 4-like [Gigantopelta aegis]